MKKISILILATAVLSSSAIWAAPKKAKTTYSVNVSNINADTVIKKGTNLKVKYTATKTKLGKVSKVKVKFKSSNKKVATISRKGVIKAKKNGTTYITVYCKNKPKKFKRVKIRVGVPVSSIKIAGYQLERACCKDMFPQTPHCECVALITKQKQ